MLKYVPTVLGVLFLGACLYYTPERSALPIMAGVVAAVVVAGVVARRG